MNLVTPQLCSAILIEHRTFSYQMANCFGHNPRLWLMPEFRLLCQVASSGGLFVIFHKA
ncbi:hypothetical protein H6G04_22205 [Calothrix membranacea FACHB-236]|nr:hypothetical protein [Calothrix membranacea FACHB-236]